MFIFVYLLWLCLFIIVMFIMFIYIFWFIYYIVYQFLGAVLIQVQMLSDIIFIH